MFCRLKGSRVTRGVEGVTSGVEGGTRGVEGVTRGLEGVTPGVEGGTRQQNAVQIVIWAMGRPPSDAVHLGAVWWEQPSVGGLRSGEALSGNRLLGGGSSDAGGVCCCVHRCLEQSPQQATGTFPYCVGFETDRK